jgi:hypothetical protein
LRLCNFRECGGPSRSAEACSPQRRGQLPFQFWSESPVPSRGAGTPRSRAAERTCAASANYRYPRPGRRLPDCLASARVRSMRRGCAHRHGPAPWASRSRAPAPCAAKSFNGPACSASGTRWGGRRALAPARSHLAVFPTRVRYRAGRTPAHRGLPRIPHRAVRPRQSPRCKSPRLQRGAPGDGHAQPPPSKRESLVRTQSRGTKREPAHPHAGTADPPRTGGEMKRSAGSLTERFSSRQYAPHHRDWIFPTPAGPCAN